MIKAVFDGREDNKDMYRELESEMILFIGTQKDTEGLHAGLIGKGGPNDVGEMLTAAMTVLSRSMPGDPAMAYIRTIGAIGDFLTELIHETKDPTKVQQLEAERAELTKLLMGSMQRHKRNEVKK